MTERRLPPALEEKVPPYPAPTVDKADLLDWLYGKEVYGPGNILLSVSTPGLVERVLNRTNELFESGWDIETAVKDALRAELVDEARAALDKFKDVRGHSTGRLIRESDLLDWLYGKEVYGPGNILLSVSTPGLVERVEERLPAWGAPEFVREVLAALRAELGMEK